MKGGESTSGADFPADDDMIVAQILLDLKSQESLIESLGGSSWNNKRMRSCLVAAPSHPIQRSQNEIKPVKPKQDGGDGRSSTSPDSPFVFPANGTKKFNHSSNQASTSRKRSKKNYLDEIEELTQENGVLRGEIGNVKKHCSKLKAYNSQLITIKQEVSRVGVADPTAQEIQYPVGPIQASVNRVGPIGFDLNVPAEETWDIEVQPLDEIADKRARYAEARKMRRGIIKTKSIKNRV